MEGRKILEIAANALNSKKAVDIFATKIDKLTVLTDYFLIAGGTSTTHVRALADEVEEKLSEAGVEPYNIEGKNSGWILIDYGTVVVHVFTKSARETYNLERLWADGETFNVSELLENPEE